MKLIVGPTVATVATAILVLCTLAMSAPARPCRFCPTPTPTATLSPSPTPTPSASPTSSPSPTSTPTWTPLPSPAPGLLYGSQGGPYSSTAHVWPGAGWQPYAASSPWNTPLPDYTQATLDPGSASEISYMNSAWAHQFTPWPVSNTPSRDESSLWGHPVYWASSSDPSWAINDTLYQCGPGVASSCPTSERIPNGAQHALSGDGHLAAIQPDGHTEVDAWQVQNANPIAGGGTVTVHGYGGLDLDGAGCCGNSTAANEGLPAGAIRGPELAASAIHHALSVVEPCSNGGHVPPATGNGAGGCSSAPPIGARLQLRMTDPVIDALTAPAYEKTILKAMAHYGVFITDTGGSPMDLQYEPAVQYTSFGDTTDTVMTALAAEGYSDPTTVTISLPWSDFQVVSSCYATGTC